MQHPKENKIEITKIEKKTIKSLYYQSTDNITLTDIIKRIVEPLIDIILKRHPSLDNWLISASNELKSKNELLATEIENFQKEINELKEKIGSLTGLKKEVDDTIIAILANQEDIRNSNRMLLESLRNSKLTEEIQTKKNEITNLENELSLIKTNSLNEKNELANLKNELESKINSFKKSIDIKSLAESRERKKNLVNKNEFLKSSLSSLNKEKKSLEHKLEKIKKENELERNLNVNNIELSSLFLGLIQAIILLNTNLLEIKEKISDNSEEYLKKIIEAIEEKIKEEKNIFGNKISEYITKKINLEKYEDEEKNKMNKEESSAFVEKIIAKFEEEFREIFETKSSDYDNWFILNNDRRWNFLNKDPYDYQELKFYHGNYQESKLMLVSADKSTKSIFEINENKYNHFLQWGSPLLKKILRKFAYNSESNKEMFFLFRIILLLENEYENKNILFDPLSHFLLYNKLESETKFKEEKKKVEDDILEFYVSKTVLEEFVNKSRIWIRTRAINNKNEKSKLERYEREGYKLNIIEETMISFWGV